MNRNRKRVNYKTCSIIILAIKWCEEHNVCTSLADWCGRERGTVRRAVIDGAPLFNFVCIAAEIMMRLCKYIPFLPYDTRIRRLREVSKCVRVRENSWIPRRQMEQTSASVICQQCYNLKWLERVVRKEPVPPPQWHPFLTALSLTSHRTGSTTQIHHKEPIQLQAHTHSHHSNPGASEGHPYVNPWTYGCNACTECRCS